MSFALPVVVQLQTAGAGTAAGLWISRMSTYLALTAVVGLLVTAGWLVREHGGGLGGQLGPVGARAMRGAAIGAGVWAVAACGMFLFGLSNATARPVTGVLDTATLGRFLATRYGSGVAVQAAVAAGVCLLAAAARDRGFARMSLGGAAFGAVALASSGHAATAPLPAVAVVSNSAHVLAAAAWVGGLLAVVLLVMPRSAPADIAAPAGRFSRLAGWALAVVLATGAVNALLHVDDAAQLLDTTWGRVVLVKITLFAGIAALGWRNRRRMLPRIGRGEGARKAFRRIAAGEVALMLAAFGSASILASGTPAAVEAAARLETVRTAYADGQVELTLSPARAGTNELHVYFFDDSGGLRETDDVTVTFTAGEQVVEARLLDSGPGHYTGPAVDLPEPGSYRVTVAGRTDGARETATTSLTVR